MNYVSVSVSLNLKEVIDMMDNKANLEHYEGYQKDMKKVISFIFRHIKFSKFTRRYDGAGEFSYRKWGFFDLGEQKVNFLFQFRQNKRGLRQLDIFLKDLVKFIEERIEFKLNFSIKVNYFQEKKSV